MRIMPTENVQVTGRTRTTMARKVTNTLIAFGVFAQISLLTVNPVSAEGKSQPLQQATGERLAMAIGHFARARSLLLAAMREFDAGYQLADPGALLDSAKWRATLARRSEELERVLDPQPRVSQGGVRYNPDTRLLGTGGGAGAANKK
jgi:hypothetical protein